MPYKDPEERRAHQRAYDEKNKDKIKVRLKRYYQTHKAKIMARTAAYQRAHNPERRAKRKRAKLTPEALQTIRTKDQQYYQRTKTRQRATALAYARKHPAERKTYITKYRRDHIIDLRISRQHWRLRNPEKVIASNQRRRASKHASPQNTLTAEQWKIIKDHYKYCCVYCGKKQQRLTMDHITPLSKGGSHTLHNVVPACQSCNSRKNAGAVPKPIQPLLL